MAVVDARGLPLGVSLHSASPAEVRLVHEAFKTVPWQIRPFIRYLIGDKAYDSDALAWELGERYWITLVAPHRKNRIHKTRDGRTLRRCKRRWPVERLFAWLDNFRRLTTRWEYHAHNYLGFLQLACCVILLRRF